MTSDTQIITAAASNRCSNIWPAWSQAYYLGNCTTEGLANQVVWVNWQPGYSCAAESQAITVNQLGEQVWLDWDQRWEQFQAEQQRVIAAQVERQTTAAKVLRDEADKKAEALLLRHLTPEQRAKYTEARYFELRTKSGLYRLYKGWAGNVARIGPDGQESDRFCIHPERAVPEADNLLSQKFMLEFEEDRFLKIANRSPGRRVA